MTESLHPLQRTFAPDPDVANDQNDQEDQHLDQAEHAQRLELDRPGKKKDGLDVEDHKQNRNDVVAHRIASAGAVYWIDAALIGHELGLARIVGTHQLGQQQRHRQQGSHQRDKDKDRNVVLRHRPNPVRHTSADAPDEQGTGSNVRASSLYTNPFRASGNSLTRFPVAANTALQIAGAIGGTPGSPTPAGAAMLSTMCTST